MPCPHKYGHKPRPTKAAALTVKLGEAGLQLLKYKGFQESEPYKGLGTAKVYIFGMDRPRGYVDARDVESLLDVLEDSQWVFEEA